MLGGVAEPTHPILAAKLSHVSNSISNMRVMLRLLDDLPGIVHTVRAWGSRRVSLVRTDWPSCTVTIDVPITGCLVNGQTVSVILLLCRFRKQVAVIATIQYTIYTFPMQSFLTDII